MNNNPAKIYERDLLGKIEPFFNTKEIIAVIGSRQVGKTTLLQIIFERLKERKKCLFLTFENRADLEIFETDVENFKKLYCNEFEVIFIDEFQYASQAGQKLKFLFDTTSTKFFISGSSSLELKEAGKYLVGRVFEFHLSSFSFSEYLRAVDQSFFNLISDDLNILSNILPSSKTILLSHPLKSQTLENKLRDHFEKYLIFGGYPRVVSSQSEGEKIQVLSSIIDNYLLREIRSLLHLATENKLVSLAQFLSLQTANLISYNELSNATGLSFKEVKKHLTILQQTLVVEFVYPYYRNRRTEIVKNPKVFFLDNGFRNKVIDNFNDFHKRTDSGVLAENFIFNSLKSAGVRVNFWRSKSQAEVDFVIESQGEIIPVEAKYSPVGEMVAGKSLFSFINKYHPTRAIITTNDGFGKRRVSNTQVYFVPIWYM